MEDGKGAILTCSARGFPSPSISWSRNTYGLQNISIMNSTDRDGYYVITSQFFINRINRNDFGVYICKAINGDRDTVNENDEYGTQCDGASIQTFPNNRTYNVVFHCKFNYAIEITTKQNCYIWRFNFHLKMFSFP